MTEVITRTTKKDTSFVDETGPKRQKHGTHMKKMVAIPGEIGGRDRVYGLNALALYIFLRKQ